MTAAAIADRYGDITPPELMTFYAICAEPYVDPDIFFPFSPGDPAAAEAKRICRYCPGRQPCLAYALEHDITHGIWGGLTPRERRYAIRRQPVDHSQERTP